MTHLTPDELVDAVEGVLADDRRDHLRSCDACRRDRDDLAAMLRDTQAVDVPEPSPLFWDRFSARVREAVAAEPTPRPGWGPAWLQWPVLAPVGALAVVVVLLATALPAPDAPGDLRAGRLAPPPAGAAPVLDPVADDASWQLLAELLGGLDLADAREAGLVYPPGVAERAVLELSADEQRALADLLRKELGPES